MPVQRMGSLFWGKVRAKARRLPAVGGNRTVSGACGGGGLDTGGEFRENCGGSGHLGVRFCQPGGPIGTRGRFPIFPFLTRSPALRSAPSGPWAGQEQPRMG
jgi:hypothetical protein